MQPQNIHYENGSLGSLLIWILDVHDRLVQYQFQIMARQPPAYLLPCLLRSRGGWLQVCQDITGLATLEQAGRLTALTPAFARQILHRVAEALLDANDQLLPIEQFSLHPSLIFLDNDLHVKLLFWPIQTESCMDEPASACTPAGQTSLEAQQAGWPAQTELAYLVQTTARACQLPDDETTLCQQALIENGVSGLLQALSPVTSSAEAGGVQSQESGSKQWNIAKSWRILVDDIHIAWHAINLWLGRLISGQDVDSRADDGQTVLLPANPADFRMAMLAEGRPGTPEENEGLRAFILVDEFLVGREQKNVDLCLGDPGIGRQHARIVRRAGSFFICDLGSRNGTRLDGMRLLKNSETLLPEQCIIQFADRSFYFYADSS